MSYRSETANSSPLNLNNSSPLAKKIRHRLKAVALTLLSLMAVAGAGNAAVLTSAGTITGIGGSGAFDDTVTLSARYGTAYAQTDGVVHIVLDLGQVEHVELFEFINRKTASTNFAISRLEILVAADENAMDFDPLSLDSYTDHVYSEQNLTPYNVIAGTVRSADITDVSKRYFLINFTQSFHTAGNFFSTSPNMDRVQFSDIKVVTSIPEPGSAVLLGIAFAGGLLLRRRK